MASFVDHRKLRNRWIFKEWKEKHVNVHTQRALEKKQRLIIRRMISNWRNSRKLLTKYRTKVLTKSFNLPAVTRVSCYKKSIKGVCTFCFSVPLNTRLCSSYDWCVIICLVPYRQRRHHFSPLFLDTAKVRRTFDEQRDDLIRSCCHCLVCRETGDQLNTDSSQIYTI